MRRFFDHDPETRETEFFHYDESDDTVTIERQIDLQPLIDANKREYNDSDRAHKDGRHVASIPMIILEKWKREKGINWMDRNHWPAIRRLLNDPDWRYLRTAPGCY